MILTVVLYIFRVCRDVRGLGTEQVCVSPVQGVLPWVPYSLCLKCSHCKYWFVSLLTKCIFWIAFNKF